MQSWNYIHAEEVLPKQLIKQIQRYTSGLLYIPTGLSEIRQTTAVRVKALKEQGMRNCEIADILKITPRHVCGILQRSQKVNKANVE